MILEYVLISIKTLENKYRWDFTIDRNIKEFMLNKYKDNPPNWYLRGYLSYDHIKILSVYPRFRYIGRDVLIKNKHDLLKSS